MSMPCSSGVLRQWGNIIDSLNLSLGKKASGKSNSAPVSSPALVSLTSHSPAHEQSFHNGALAARAPGIGVLECDCLVVWAGGLWGVVSTGLVTGTEAFPQLPGIGSVGTRSGCFWSCTIDSFLPTQCVR